MIDAFTPRELSSLQEGAAELARANARARFAWDFSLVHELERNITRAQRSLTNERLQSARRTVAPLTIRPAGR